MLMFDGQRGRAEGATVKQGQGGGGQKGMGRVRDRNINNNKKGLQNRDTDRKMFFIVYARWRKTKCSQMEPKLDRAVHWKKLYENLDI